MSRIIYSLVSIKCPAIYFRRFLRSRSYRYPSEWRESGLAMPGPNRRYRGLIFGPRQVVPLRTSNTLNAFSFRNVTAAISFETSLRIGGNGSNDERYVVVPFFGDSHSMEEYR